MDRKKKRKKKTKKRTREAIGRAPDHDARKSWTSIRHRLLSFPFESLLIFFCTTRVPFDSNASRLARARIFISSSLRAEYQHQHQHHRAHASTRAPFVVGKSFGKSSESRGEVREEQKRKSGNRSRVREEETEIQGRDEESTRKINTREAWKRTKNSSNSSKDTHRTAQTHARTETRTQRERGTDNTQREIE